MVIIPRIILNLVSISEAVKLQLYTPEVVAAGRLLEIDPRKLALQASSMVGRKVLIPGSMSTLSEGTQMKAAVELEDNVSDVKVSIMNDNGALVKEINLGTKAAGVAHFSWDGMLSADKKAMSGNYTIRAIGTVDGKAESLKTLISDTVQSVSLGTGGQGVSLTLANAGSAGLADVKEIL